MERRTPPNLCLAGLPAVRLAGSPAVEATTATVLVTASRFAFLRAKKKPCSAIRPGLFGAWKDALRIASRRSWKVSACSPRRRRRTGRRNATGARAATALPSATCSRSLLVRMFLIASVLLSLARRAGRMPRLRQGRATIAPIWRMSTHFCASVRDGGGQRAEMRNSQTSRGASAGSPSAICGYLAATASTRSSSETSVMRSASAG